MIYVLGGVFGWLIPLIACIVIGKEKNRNGFLWGFFLGVFGLIVVAVLPPLDKVQVNYQKSKQSSERLLKSTEMKCPSCNSIIDAAFKKCPNCGIDIQEINNRRNSRTIFANETNDENNSIICPYCDNKISLNIKTSEFVKMKCTYCKKVITKKNVQFI